MLSKEEPGHPILELSKVHVQYGAVPALKGVSLIVGSNEMVAIVGPNGAGKSTLMQAVAGVVAVKSGSIHLKAKSLVGQGPEVVARLGLSLVPERRRIFARLTVEENLIVAGSAQGKRGMAELLDSMYERLPMLRERRRSLAGDLSGGQQQQLAIARALMTRPEILLVDEPSLGLAPMMTERIFDLLSELPKKGISVLVVEQNALAAIGMCDRLYVLNAGRITMEGEGTDRNSRAELARAYMEQIGLEHGDGPEWEA